MYNCYFMNCEPTLINIWVPLPKVQTWHAFRPLSNGPKGPKGPRLRGLHGPQEPTAGSSFQLPHMERVMWGSMDLY